MHNSTTFLAMIEESRMPEGLVRELTIIPMGLEPFFPPFASISRRLRGLRAMSLSVDPTVSTPYHAPRTLRFTAVVYLKLSNVTFSNKSDVARLLCMFPRLRLLQLGTIEFKKQPSKSLERTAPRARPIAGMSLKELEIVDVLVRMTGVTLELDDEEVDACRTGTKSVSIGTHGCPRLHAGLALHQIESKMWRRRWKEAFKARDTRSRARLFRAGRRW